MENCVPVKLAYSVFEPTSGTDETLSPIIFLHGVTATKVYWDDIPQYIANGSKRKVYTLDARNHGDSEYTEEFSFNLNVMDLFYFMDTIHAPQVVLVGHSMGGITTIKAALAKPERIEMVFVEDIFTKNLPEEIILGVIARVNILTDIVKALPIHLSESEANQLAVMEFVKKTTLNMPQVQISDSLKDKRILLKKLPDGKYEVNFNKESILSALMDPERVKTNPNGEFNGPAYFIYGSTSAFEVGKEKDDIKKYFPNVEFIEIEGATHLVHMEFPDIFKNTISNGLKRH